MSLRPASPQILEDLKACIARCRGLVHEADAPIIARLLNTVANTCDEAYRQLKLKYDAMDVAELARHEFQIEEFRREVDVAKERLRTVRRRKWWQKFFPFEITITKRKETPHAKR